MSHHAPTDSNKAPALHPGNQAPVTTGSILSASSSKLEISKEQVLSEALDVREDFLRRDLWNCLKMFGTLSIPQQDLVKFLIKQPKFHKWLQAPTSQVLLINANADGPEATSPVTCLSARLLQDLRKITSIVTLHFFCSRSIRLPQNITDDAAGMLRVFMAQILHMIPDLSFLDHRQLKKIEEGRDVDVLFDVFKKMLSQLRSKTYVFCVIDNIALYETSGRSDDFERVVQKLRELTMDESGNLIIKVLFTCHRQSWLVDHLVDDEDTLSGFGAHQEDRQGLSELAWKLYMKKSLEELGYAANSVYD